MFKAKGRRGFLLGACGKRAWRQPLSKNRCVSLSTTTRMEAMMTTPARAIRDEVDQLIGSQIETFGQPTPLTSSQLDDFHDRSEKIRALCEELNRLGTRSVMDRHHRASA